MTRTRRFYKILKEIARRKSQQEIKKQRVEEERIYQRRYVQ
jgi:hypothetical protein